MSESDLDIVKKFIFNDKIQKVIHEINDNFLDLNILEITGMGTQEIKHSNILSWLLGDNEHQFKYSIFNEFLKKIYIENECNNINLQNYMYLSKKESLEIFREKDNIDILIIDKKNKKLFIFENKIFAAERKGEVNIDGQLEKYEKIINKKFNNDYEKYFIFLTPNLEDASRKNWLNASYEMIAEIIYNILKHKEITIKIRLILESYLDSLKNNKIIKDKKMEDLCKEIWKNEDYKRALDIIFDNKPNKSELVFETVNKEIFIETKKNSGNYNYFLKFDKKSPIIYRLIYNSKGSGLAFVLTCLEKEKYKIKEFNESKIYEESIKINKQFFTEKPVSQFGYYAISNVTKYCIVEEKICEKSLSQLINELRKFDETYNEIN